MSNMIIRRVDIASHASRFIRTVWQNITNVLPYHVEVFVGDQEPGTESATTAQIHGLQLD